MLRVIQHYQNKILAGLKNGTYGNGPDDFETISNTGPSFGITSKELRNIFLTLSKLVTNDGVLIGDELSAEAVDMLLLVVGFTPYQREHYKYVGNKDNYKARLSTRRWTDGKETIIEVGIVNEKYNDDGIVINTDRWAFNQTRVDIKRRRFDLALDNPLHVVTALDIARKTNGRVVLSINQVVGGHPLKTKTFVIALFELLNIAMFWKTAGFRERYLPSHPGALPDFHARYFAMDAFVSVIMEDLKSSSRFIIDFTDGEEMKVTHKFSGGARYVYSVMAKPNPFRYQIPSNIVGRMLSVRKPRDNTDFKPGVGLTLAKSLRDIIELEKYFHIKDNDTSTKSVTGSLRDYYTINGGSDLVLVWSLAFGVVGERNAWTLALYDVSNGQQVIRCDAMCVLGGSEGDARVVHPVTIDDDLGYNLVDTVIFTRRVGAILKSGRFVIVRRKDKTAFTLHPYALEALPYAGDKDEVTDDRIKAQVAACFTNVVEVELKPKLVEEKRGYQFLVEPQR